jgi:hypothetical protein
VIRAVLLSMGLAASLVANTGGPYDIALLNTPKTPTARGHARLVSARSPFGIAVTADGRASYDVQIEASGLPEPSSLGAYTSYVGWAASTDLKEWHRLGVVKNGTSVIGRVELNKFLLVITAEPSDSPSTHSGPTALHGTSPSGWLQSFLSHPLFRGIPP